MAHPNSNRVEFTAVPDLPPGVEVTQAMKDAVAAEVAKWRADPKYIPMFPFPVKIVSDKSFPPAPYELPPGNGYGVRIVSNGTPQGTIVMDAEGKLMGPLEGLEILPLSADNDKPLRCRITMPISYLDITAAEERPGEFDPVVNLLDHVLASEKIPNHRLLTDKLLRVLRSEHFTLWPPAAAEAPDSKVDILTCAACGQTHRGLERVAVGEKVTVNGAQVTHIAVCTYTGKPIFIWKA